MLYSDAVQLVFSMHCCLHLVGQPVSVGRLDQLLISFYERDIKNGSLSPEKVPIYINVSIVLDPQCMVIYY